MVNLKDIYYKVGKNLYEQGFDFQTTERKKEMVDESLKNYLSTKIAEATAGQAPMLNEDSDVSVDELVYLLGDLVPKEEHFDTLRHLTHFILKIAGEMQGWGITWWEEHDVEYIDNPLLDFNKGGKIESLTTHKETSYVQTFQFVHEIYKDIFMEKETKNKQLALKDKIAVESNN